MGKKGRERAESTGTVFGGFLRVMVGEEEQYREMRIRSNLDLFSLVWDRGTRGICWSFLGLFLDLYKPMEVCVFLRACLEWPQQG